MIQSTFPTSSRNPRQNASEQTDVLVIGGGPAGAWAAIAAAAKGARVRLYEKGFFGTSGATAPSGNSIWYVPDQGGQREAAKASRYDFGGRLAEHAWMDRVLEQTWQNIHQLSEWGYPFPVDEAGQLRGESLQGPEYMRIMRKAAKAHGVRIFDHSPALELLTDRTGQVCGAAGLSRQKNTRWSVQAGAVILATGGCAFLSKALGCNVLTGDGYLFAAEVGAEFSGMEFSNSYGLGPAFSSVTKSLFYHWATFYDERGVEIAGAGSSHGRGVIAQHLQSGKVYARLDKADGIVQAWMRNAQPNFFVPLDRLGIDPFTQRFEVTLRLEGTVRGTGGINVIGADCATSVPGLYAAGDAATRELICGGFTGGGSHNAGWAMSSGLWAGHGAADFALQHRSEGQAAQDLFGAGTVALQDGGGPVYPVAQAIDKVQREVFPTAKNWFRHGDALEDSLHHLDDLWTQLRGSAPVEDAQALLRSREAAAMAMSARLMYRSAQARTETRGMARRKDFAALDPAQRYRLISHGLDEITLRRQAVLDRATAAASSGRTQVGAAA
ncbi:MAG: FAD-binding protein [Burkholderiaceae bacterium]|jgi:succinate dehydrogenase/fumarate reductase flavoprotein subunit|nr:FAD-binding protein [Burkholderiaceae bacterium]